MIAAARLVRHLVWYDLRATRVLSLVWLALVALDLAVLALGPGDVQDEFDRIPIDLFLELGRVLGAAVVTVAIVHRDPLVDVAAFWRTRPIPRITLWASKWVSVLALVVVAPAMLLGVALLAAGLQPGDAARGAVDLAFDHLGVAAVAMALAAPTRSLSQAVIVALGAAVLLISAGMLIDPLLPSWLDYRPAPAPAFSAAVAIILAGLITVLHYVTLRRRLVIGLTSGAALLVVFMMSGQTPFVPQTRPPAPASLVAPGSVEVTLRRSSELWRPLDTTADAGHAFAAPMDVRSADPSLIFVPRLGRTTLHLAGRDAAVWTSVDEPRPDQRRPVTAADTPFAQVSALEKLPPIRPPERADVRANGVSFQVLPSAFAALQAGTASASVAIDFDVHQLQPLFTLPVAVGATAMVPGGRVRVVSVSVRNTDVDVQLHWLRSSQPTGPPAVLYDPTRRWAVAGGTWSARRSATGWWLDLDTTRQSLTFPLPAGARSGTEAGGAPVMSIVMYEQADTGFTYAASIGVSAPTPAP